MTSLQKLLLFFGFLLVLQGNCKVSFAQNVVYEKNKKNLLLKYNRDEPKIASYEYVNSWLITDTSKTFTFVFVKNKQYIFKLKPTSKKLLIQFTLLDKNKKKLFSEVIDNQVISNIVMCTQVVDVYYFRINNLCRLPTEIMIFFPIAQ